MWETLDIMVTRESAIMGLLEHVCGPCFQLVYSGIPIKFVFYFFCLGVDLLYCLSIIFSSHLCCYWV